MAREDRSASTTLSTDAGWNTFVAGRRTLYKRLMRAALLVVGLLSLASCKKDASASAPTEGVVAVTADQDGFKPSSVTFKKGAPATLVFTRTTDQTCATEVVFPELDLKKELPKGTAVSVPIPTDKERSLTFQCGMGMFKSAVVITAK